MRKSKTDTDNALSVSIDTDRRHKRIQYTDCEGSAAGKRLSEVELRVRIVVIVLIKKLHVAVIDKLCRKERDRNR
jgi:hypothetical protein